MKHAIVILSVLFLVGCSTDVRNWEMKAANAYCVDRGGIDYIYASFTGPSIVTCLDGRQASIGRPRN